MQASRQSTNHPRHAALVTSLLAAAIAGLAGLSCLPLLGSRIPLWLQPSLVGVVWGSIFLSGCWFAFASHCSWQNLAVVACALMILNGALHVITDLNIEECMLASVTLVTCGWLAMRVDQRPGIALRVVNSNWRQLPVMDLFVITTLVACTLGAVTRMTSPPSILLSIMVTLFIGCGCCWAMYHWAWNDDRPVGVPILLTSVLSAFSILVVYRVSPLTPAEFFSWLLQGPLSVIAAQSFTVLAVLAVLRLKRNACQF